MKKLLLVLAIPLFIVIFGIATLLLLVNPNQFKPLIVEQAQKQTGLELAIEGDIGWSFFPTLGFELGKTELKNPQGYSQENLFKVDQVSLSVAVLPLFDQKLEIGNIVLKGAQINVETLKGGEQNIAALAGGTSSESAASEPQSASNETSSPTEPTENTLPWTISLAGIEIVDASIEIQDHQTNSFTKLSPVSFTLTEFAFDKWSSIAFSITGENNQQSFKASGETQAFVASGFTTYELKQTQINAAFSDPTTQIDTLEMTLDTFKLDQDNPLQLAIKGSAADLKLDIAIKTQVKVLSDFTKVFLNRLDVKANFKGETLPQSPMKVEVLSDIAFNNAESKLAITFKKLMANQLVFDGGVNVKLQAIPRVRFTLNSDKVDLDEFLGLTKAQPAESTQETNDAPKQPAKEVEPDLTALKTLDVAGKVSIKQFKANNAKLQNVKVDLSVLRGIAKLKSFTANLYQGSIKASARLDAIRTPAQYTLSKDLKGVKVHPLLVDVVQNDKLEGTGDISARLHGQSLTPSGIKKNLAGQVDINFADGAVNGINVAQLIRENYAKFKGKSLPPEESKKQTDFSALSATLQLNKGVVTTDNLKMQSPLLRIHGEGSANYISETVDFSVFTSIVGTLEGQGGKDVDELRDFTIPLNISGAWADPKFDLLFDEILKQKAAKEIERGKEKAKKELERGLEKLQEEETQDKIKDALKKLF